MSQQAQSGGIDRHSLFAFFYRNRVRVTKGDSVIVNLSFLFTLLSLLCAPWLVIIGGISALLLGYRFSLERNARQFSGSFDSAYHTAAETVREAAEAFAHPREGGSENE